MAQEPVSMEGSKFTKPVNINLAARRTEVEDQRNL